MVWLAPQQHGHEASEAVQPLVLIPKVLHGAPVIQTLDQPLLRWHSQIPRPPAPHLHIDTCTSCHTQSINQSINESAIFMSIWQQAHDCPALHANWTHSQTVPPRCSHCSTVSAARELGQPTSAPAVSSSHAKAMQIGRQAHETACNPIRDGMRRLTNHTDSTSRDA